ncbi:MAG: hypothetical protein HQL88_09765, partial [Magnetococcales bacterium]|nr:hypothetical protein [Magnetococcales bacterium]
DAEVMLLESDKAVEVESLPPAAEMTVPELEEAIAKLEEAIAAETARPAVEVILPEPEESVDREEQRPAAAVILPEPEKAIDLETELPVTPVAIPEPEKSIREEVRRIQPSPEESLSLPLASQEKRADAGESMAAASEPVLTMELLREAYGARVERVVAEMAQRVLREILPGLLEEAIRDELARIKNMEQD